MCSISFNLCMCWEYSICETHFSVVIDHLGVFEYLLVKLLHISIAPWFSIQVCDFCPSNWRGRS